MSATSRRATRVVLVGWGAIGTVAGKEITGTNLFICGLLGLVVTALIVVITE